MSATMTKLGPADHGRPMRLAEFDECENAPGFRAELIDGKVSVSPLPNFPHENVIEWLHGVLRDYSEVYPDVIDFVSGKSRLFPVRDAETVPEPDLAAFRDTPFHLPRSQRSWDMLSPVIVVEALSSDNAEKDTVRNMDLYLDLPTLVEYWIVDPLEDEDRPILRVRRRLTRRRWQREITVPFGGTYETPVLPGLKLTFSPP